MRSRIVTALLAAVVSVPVLAGAAAADPVALNAPYARAAAKVGQDRTLLAAKNVSSSARSSSLPSGTYCVKVSDPTIDLPNAAVLATVNNRRAMITAIVQPHSYCGNEADTITIVTTDSNNNPVDVPFTVAVL
ncbi:hypothetical protein [Streptomyces sp. NPDC127092]|uniref:hypothetical protein n=1 Tax=Streptomyces sp. NPDC127092 TaxID=3347135 RepID=UPI0036621861